MSKKVKLPKDVCIELNKVKKEMLGVSNFKIVNGLVNNRINHSHHSFFNEQNADVLYLALTNGYEPELTKEEKMKKQYVEGFGNHACREIYREGIRDALNIHNIHYDWLGDEE